MKSIIFLVLLLAGCSMPSTPKGTPVTTTSTVNCINEPAEQASKRIKEQIESCYSWHKVFYMGDSVNLLLNRTKKAGSYYINVDVEETNTTVIDTTPLNSKWSTSDKITTTHKDNNFYIKLEPLKTPTQACQTEYTISTNTGVYIKQRNLVKEIVTNKSFVCKDKGDYL